jgi:ribosome-binding ATPase YchF (GTP1/OBG family)
MNDLVQADAFILVVDASGSTDEEGADVTNYDPMRSLASFLRRLMNGSTRLLSATGRAVRKKDKPMRLLAEKLSGLGIRESDVKAAGEISDLRQFSDKLLSISKPYVIAANKADKGNKIDGNPVSAIIELTLRDAAAKGFIDYVPGERAFKVIKDLSEKQSQGLEFVKSFLSKQSTGVQELLNKLVFELLNCIVVYPVMDEHKWTDAKGHVLPDAT